MKKIFYLIIASSLFIGNINAQTPKSWTYNFGTTAGNLSPTAAAGILSANDGVTGHINSILPAPADGQIARIWTGNKAANPDTYLGGFSLTNSGTIGSGARLLFNTAPTSSTHKFSILNIDGTAVMSVGFKLKFETGTNGDYRFAIGRDVSTMNWNTAVGGTGVTQFANGNNFNDENNTPTILIMQWRLTSSGYKLMIKEKKSLDNNVNFSGWKDLNTTLNPISFVNGGEYDIQVYANNSASSTTYIKSGTKTITSRACHIWINNTQLFYDTGNPNFIDVGTSLGGGDALNAFMFLGYNNTVPLSSPPIHDAQALLDDFVYANYLGDLTTLPVAFDGFSATKQNNGVLLNWKTLSEQDNARFEILRASDKNENFRLIKTVSGKGNTSSVSNYNTTDNSPLIGNNYYKLVQVDVNGNADTLATAVANVSLSKNDFDVYVESNSTVKLFVTSQQQENAVLEIFNTAGQSIATENIRLSEGNNELLVPVELSAGVYVAVLKTQKNQHKIKFVAK